MINTIEDLHKKYDMNTEQLVKCIDQYLKERNRCRIKNRKIAKK